MNELRTTFIINLSHVKFVMIQQSPKKKGVVLFFWPIFISEKRTTFAKTYGLKKGVIENVLKNITRAWKKLRT